MGKPHVRICEGLRLRGLSLLDYRTDKIPLGTKGCTSTLPYDDCASIPCGVAVRKQHKMLFAASKFEKLNTEKLTVDWSQSAKS